MQLGGKPLFSRLPWRARAATIAAATVLAACALPACTTATGAAEAMVRVHATRDLDCPDDQVLLTEELGGWYKAVGCGRKARYRTACDVLNCEVRGADEPPIPWRDRPPPDAPKP
jgi:hypothetical protein